jgi:hypothetical protein
MKLVDLLATAASGSAVLTDANGESIDLNALGAARLYAAVAEDRMNMSLGGMDLQTAPVELENADAYVVTVAGVLRYAIDDSEHAVGTNAVERLCTTPHCPGSSVGAALWTRVCEDHLDVVIPGMLPNAGDDILPGDRESAAVESRRKRLDVWEQEIEARERELAGDRRALAKLCEN